MSISSAKGFINIKEKLKEIDTIFPDKLNNGTVKTAKYYIFVSLKMVEKAKTCRRL